jgi:hypothetical protein
MKKTIFLIAAFVLAAVISQAQTEKGTQTLGLGLGFGYNKSNGIATNPYGNASSNLYSKSTNFSIGPDYSYFIADKLDIGTSLSYGTNTYSYPLQSNNSLYKQSSYSYGGIIYLRKYFMYNDKFGLRAGPYAGYTRGDSKSTNVDPAYNSDSKTDSYNAGAKLDLVYYPSKKISFSATLANLNYAHYKTNGGPQGHSSADSFNAAFINNGLGISIFYIL